MAAHGVSRGIERIKRNEPRSGERARHSPFSLAPSGTRRFFGPVPTAHAVGYPLPLLRSYFHDFCDVQILICAQIGRSSRTRLDGSGPFNLISPARWMAESTARPNNFQRLMPLMERFAL